MSDTALRGAEVDTSAVLGIVDGLVTYARANLLLDPRDEDWMRNRMLELFNANEELCSRADLLAKGLPEDVPEALLNDDEVMGALSALPSRVEDEFGRLRAADGGMEAMQWLYDYGVANGYIKLAQLNRNIRFNSAGLGDHHQYGETRVHGYAQGRSRQQRGRQFRAMHNLPCE